MLRHWGVRGWGAINLQCKNPIILISVMYNKMLFEVKAHVGAPAQTSVSDGGKAMHPHGGGWVFIEWSIPTRKL